VILGILCSAIFRLSKHALVEMRMNSDKEPPLHIRYNCALSLLSGNTFCMLTKEVLCRTTFFIIIIIIIVLVVLKQNNNMLTSAG
jgi:hypothetical protein